MTSTKVDIQKLHFEHQLWMNELSFFADEIKIYERRLEDLVGKSKDKEMLAGLEQFQNQFIRQKEVLDELKHDIKIHETIISNIARADGKAEERDGSKHDKVKDRIATFRNIYWDLKQDFQQFFLRWKG
jgi:hypothetical protein